MTTTNQDKMNAYTQHQGAGTVDPNDSRDVDKRALLSCASRLKAAIDDQGTDMKAYGDAIRHNQRLWTIFQVAVCDPENPLPRELKATLLNLSRYVDKVSFRAITAFTPQLLTSLIEINRTIASGLTKKAEQAAPPRVEQQMQPPAMAGSVMTSA